MPPRTKRTTSIDNINPELETRVSVLEQTVLMQNTATNKQLEGIARVVHEIHDKVDKHLLEQAVKTTTLDVQTKHLDKSLGETNKRTDRRFANIRNTAIAILVAVIGGAFTIWAAFLQ